MRRLAFLLALLPAVAWGQQTPGLRTGQVPTAAQWNSYFSTKADTTSGTLNSPNVNGGNFNNIGLSGTISGNPVFSGSPTFLGAFSFTNLVASGTSALNGNTTVGTASSAASLFVTGPSGSSRLLQWTTGGTANANRRYQLFANTTAESSTATGSDLDLFTFDNTGTSQGILMRITRSTGSINLDQTKAYLAKGGTFTNNMFTTLNSGLQIAGTYTATAGQQWTPGTSSNPVYYNNITVTGTNDTGVGTPYFVQIADTANAEARGTAMSALLWTYNYSAPADGPRFGQQLTFNKNDASGTGSNNFVAYANFAHFSAGEGGSSGASNAKGAYWLHNDDIQCGGTFMIRCLGNEFDYRHLTGASALQDAIMVLHNGINDDGHGSVVDTMLSFDSATSFTPGHGGRTKLITFGTAGTGWPIDINQSNATLIGIEPWVFGSFGGSGVLSAPAKYYAAWGVDFRIGHFTSAAWASPGWTLDGHGQVNMGASTLTYSGTGTLLHTPNFQTVSAVVAAGGSNYQVGDELMDTIGGLWSVATLSGSAVATVTLLETGYGAACPGSPTATTGGVGSGATLTITCSQPLTTQIGATTETVLLGGGSALATGATVGFVQVPTMAGAPTGNCGGAAGKACLVVDTTNKKVCYNISGTTWECSAAFTP